jgi:uncharacterized protein (TIGR02145 family)
MRSISTILYCVFFIMATVIINSCKKEKVNPPVLTTKVVSEITPVAAASGGEIANDGGTLITSRGICWSTSQNPVIENSKTKVTGTIGAFTSKLDNLTPATLYYIRAYATNSAGTGYGNEVSFTTLQPDPVSVSDVDGNTYNVIRFGTQVWMKENLKTTKWPDGTAINLINSDGLWGTQSVTSRAYCWLNDDIAFKDVYGALYTWAGALGACPTGWHVPSNDEWSALITYSGGQNAAASNLTISYNNGFAAKPGGTRTSTGSFFGADRFGYWWTSTQFDSGNARDIYIDFSAINLFNEANYNNAGLSVRCIMNN